MRTLTRGLAAIAAAAALTAGSLVPATATEPVIDPKGYWSAERLRAAAAELPVDQGSPVPASSRALGWGSATTVNHTVGRLFLRTPTGDTSCTAAVVNSATKNLVITAGHCVHPGGPGHAYYGNFLFAPGWNNGPSAHGYWSGTAVGASAEWTQSKKWDHDYAFVRLAANGGQQLANRVGGNAVAAGAGHVQANVQIWGYPVLAPYTGQDAYRCDVSTTRVNSYAPDARAACGFTHGASGGPWLKDVQSSGLGTVWAVTSRCESPPAGGSACAGTALFAAPLPAAVFALRDAVGAA
ncbi:trypsin-like serine peptidase [Leifsonia sp. NPDC056665]|uniref:trypsin-like serine peptidase n=1 Tax=Leifsonia sp. NPDC056665 TaxID=3345901 RepID=UPI0036A60E5C